MTKIFQSGEELLAYLKLLPDGIAFIANFNLPKLGDFFVIVGEHD